ncbi:putative single stranded DNA binding protein [Erwinia phage pEa_SNUABM_5]|uniref:Putative single stranded DNA binding protein n=1 Tax=Erwinia phage pEa_SNUABM_5 TaxID=2797313 RepID=A0A7T8IVS5_9CAUD|nr:putative single stranded DNA binding protein [Erwinia phage pEa_SNUABM_5]QQO90391.1 putative single stranded DNA binding protein [Erwinia phage pEa_SNUABM_5]
MGRGFDSIPDKSSRDNVRETDLFEVYQLNKKAKDTWVTLRFLPGDLLPIKKHWIKIMGGKDKDKELKIPRMCVSFDPDSANSKEPLRGMKCPYCALEHGNDESGAPAQYDFKWWTQAIVRDEQASAPRKQPKRTKTEQKTGKKEKTSDSWTPVYCIPLTNSQAGMIRTMGERNFAMVKDKKSGQKIKTQFPITDAKYGLDIDIKYVPSNPPTNRYVMEKGERTPLTEEERDYLTWNFDDWEGIYDALGRLNEADAMTDFKKMDVIGTNSDSDDDDDDDDDSMSLGKKKKGKGKDSSAKSGKKRRALDDDEDDDDDDEDEDDRPSKKKKATKSKRLLDDDEDDDDDDDEDEDDRPKKKKKSSGKSSKSSKSVKKKSKRDDDDEDDEDDEDEKPKKKKKSSDKSSKSSVKKKKKSSDDDEPVKKKKKKK